MGLFDKLRRGPGDGDPGDGDPGDGDTGDGDPGTAIVTGIRARSNDDSTEIVYRLEWNDGAGREGAVQFGGDAPMSLRIGAEVLVRKVGGSVVLDASGMADIPTAPQDPGRKKRSVPDVGVDDKALDSRVLSHLNKWTPSRGTITTWERAKMFGLLTENWNVVVTKADGEFAKLVRDNIPHYARWFVYTGSEVPITVDPKDPARMQVDWPALAEERAGGSWRDAPPEGSIAADLFESRTGPAGVGDVSR